MGEVGSVAAAVEGVEAVQAAQSLRGHRPFHRMEDAGVSETEETGRVGDQLTGWIAEIPGDQIHLSVNVTGGTGHRAVAGKFRVVEEAATVANHLRCGIVTADRDFLEQSVAGGIENRNRVGNAIEDVQTLGGSVQGQATRPSLM